MSAMYVIDRAGEGLRQEYVVRLLGEEGELLLATRALPLKTNCYDAIRCVRSLGVTAENYLLEQRDGQFCFSLRDASASGEPLAISKLYPTAAMRDAAFDETLRVAGGADQMDPSCCTF